MVICQYKNTNSNCTNLIIRLREYKFWDGNLKWKIVYTIVWCTFRKKEYLTLSIIIILRDKNYNYYRTIYDDFMEGGINIDFINHNRSCSIYLLFSKK